VGALNVSAIIVTRGNVPLTPILDSLPREWERLIWNNADEGGHPYCEIQQPGKPEGRFVTDLPNLSVYGRYAAIEYASGDVIYVQDDDCIVSHPDWIVQHYKNCVDIPVRWPDYPLGTPPVVCNMPEPWRSQPFYAEHGLVGFGAAFHRDAPKRAFDIFAGYNAKNAPRTDIELGSWPEARPWFLRTCDVVFTTLTPRVLVDVPHESFDYAWDADRMWRQPDHQGERERMLDLVLQVARAR
jgi:hypothetical protein